MADQLGGVSVGELLALADRAVRERELRIDELRLRIGELRLRIGELEAKAERAVRERELRIDELRLRIGELEAKAERAVRGRDYNADAYKRIKARLEEQSILAVGVAALVREKASRVFELEQALLHVLQAVMGCRLYGVVSRKCEPQTDVERALVEIEQVVRGVLGGAHEAAGQRPAGSDKNGGGWVDAEGNRL